MKLNKKQLEEIHSKKSTMEEVTFVRPQGPQTRYVFTFSLTAGEMVTLQGALNNHDTAVGQDLVAYFNNALDQNIAGCKRHRVSPGELDSRDPVCDDCER